MSGEVTRDQFIGLLRSIVEGRRTGTLYARTDENHLIAVGLQEGNIVSLICGPKQGERAIPMIRGMRSCTCHLDYTVTPHRKRGASLPSSESLLKRLETAEEDRSPAGDQDGNGDTPFTADYQWVQDALCKMLGDYMGPIAPVVCQESVEAAGGIDTREKIRLVVDRLANEIDDSAEAEGFKIRARAEFGNLLG